MLPVSLVCVEQCVSIACSTRSKTFILRNCLFKESALTGHGEDGFRVFCLLWLNIGTEVVLKLTLGVSRLLALQLLVHSNTH